MNRKTFFLIPALFLLVITLFGCVDFDCDEVWCELIHDWFVRYVYTPYQTPGQEETRFYSSAQYHSGGIVTTANKGEIYVSGVRDTTLDWEPRLVDVKFIHPPDESPMNIIVGSNGTILRGTQGNSVWTFIESNVFHDFHRINYCEADLSRIFIVGDYGTLLTSTDLGLTWNSVPIPFGHRINDIRISNISTGDAFTYPFFRGVFFSDTHNGWVVGWDGTMLRAAGGENEWSIQDTPTKQWLRDIFFIDENTGWAVGENGAILKTTDGGNSWVGQNSGVTAAFHSVFFIDKDAGTVVGTMGSVLRTTDGGNTWVSQQSGTLQPLTRVQFIDTDNGWIFGGNNILKTTDGGNTWTTILAPIFASGGFFIDADTGWIIGDNGAIYKTSDGIHWQKQNSGTTHSLSDVHFTDAQNGTVVGLWGTILRTTDGGNIWVLQDSNEDWALQRVYFTDTNNGIIVGDLGTILRTRDGGNNWVGDAQILCGHIIVSGSEYTLLTSRDGGRSWSGSGINKTANIRDYESSTGPNGIDASPENQLLTFDYNRIYFYDDTLGFVGGSIGSMLKTTDGGLTWKPQPAGGMGMEEINDIYFITPETGVVVGTNGKALFTFDGGDTWFEEPHFRDYLDGRDVNMIFTLGPDHGFLIGEGLLDFAAPDSTYWDSVFVITSIGENHSTITDYALYQNYPNPFNPTTTIEYRIPNPGFVTLKIFDLVGREIATLVNEEKLSGRYTVQFDASNLASGIYFHHLKVQPVGSGGINPSSGSGKSFMDTKKLVFIK